MKKYEREIVERFDNKQLTMDPKFKSQLKEKVMRKAAKKDAPRRNLWIYPFAIGAAAVAAFVLTQIPLVTQNNVKQPIVNIGTQRASAATIERGSAAFRSNLKNVAFIVNTEELLKGKQYDACSQGAMGVQPGETWTTYAFMSKESGSEAFYQTKRTESGVIRQSTSYYNPSNTALSEVVTSMLGYPFSLNEGAYSVIDDNGKVVSSDTMFTAKKINGKNVYEVKVATTDRSLRCGEGELVFRYLIDPATFATLEYAQYVNTFDESNLVYRGTVKTTTENLSEGQAIQRMEKAGFNKSGATSEFPGTIPS
jgi:hypothetical protein